MCVYVVCVCSCVFLCVFMCVFMCMCLLGHTAMKSLGQDLSCGHSSTPLI